MSSPSSRSRSGSKRGKARPAKARVAKKAPRKRASKRSAKPREVVSQREYARRRGVAHTSVQDAITSGRLKKAVVGVKKQIDPVIADREWKRNTDQSKPRNSVTGKPKARRGKGKPSKPMDLDGAQAKKARAGGGGGNGKDHKEGNGADQSYSDWRARREASLAQIAELELDERLGLLVRASDVRRAAFESARKARNQLTSMPERISAVLASIATAGEIQVVLEEEIEKICEEMSGADTERS